MSGVSEGEARAYSPRFFQSYLNRMIQPDTIVPEPGNPQALNRYANVNNNPINATDPTGHETCYDTGVEIGQGGISQADCWAYGRDRFIHGLDVPAPVAGGGYHTPGTIGPNQGDVWGLVNIWVEALATRGGDVGKQLADWFRQADIRESCRSLGMDDTMTCKRLPGHGITIVLADPGGGVAMQTDVNSNTIIIAPGILDQASRSETDLLITAGEFGHEIQHLRQGPLEHLSLHSERDAYEVQYQLYVAMEIDVSSASAPVEAQIATAFGHNLVGATDAELINSGLGQAYPNAPLYKLFWWADPALRWLNNK